jgi:phosphoglycerol transferase MdoB-like AlkP superfamily enzyme
MIDNINKFISPVIIKTVKIYLVAILFFTIFRIILFLTEIDRLNSSVSISDIILAFLMGVRFDTVITSYILVLPFVILTMLSFFDYKFLFIKRFFFFYIFVLFFLAFMVCAVDIPYFNQFFSRFSISAFGWIDSPAFIFNMIIEEARYWWTAVPFFISIFFFYRWLKKIYFYKEVVLQNSIVFKIFFSIVFLFIMFLGIRGRLDEKSPIRVGTAYFSNNGYLNQLGLNPNFTLLNSYLESRKPENKFVKLIDDKIAISNVQKYFNINIPDKNFPILRTIKGNDSLNYNIVLIIMESMSAAKMQRHGNTNNLTPFLDSISNSGYYFENTYTAGIHTFNGVFSSLFSYPALFRQHPMKGSSMKIYRGLFNTLRKKNYSTIYFTTHDGQFDNVEGFLKANDCETIISKDDYPSEEIKTTLGVPDDFMFRFSIPYLNDLSHKNKPFVAAYMTASDHGPYYIPEYFKPKNSDIKNQIVEYADYSLQKFIELSSKEDWFSNTIFVFVADHGAAISSLYDMSLDYNHTPLLFYAPNIITEAKTFTSMAGQIDIFPTLMGLLNLSYENNSLGIDLLRESRPYIFFNADDKYGVVDNEWFLIVRNDGSKSLYRYRDKNTHNFADEKTGVVERMNVYAQSNLQTFQYLIKSNKQ